METVFTHRQPVPTPDVAPTVGDVVAGFVRHPSEYLLRRWNWKSAATSAIVRAFIFFAANLSAGWHAAAGAFGAELCFRAATSGFYGAMTEALVPVKPDWAAALAAVVVVPAISHSLEFVVHYARGTPALWRSIAWSAAFTIVSTGFNLFAMRRGVLVVGSGRRSMLADMRELPAVIYAFVRWIVVRR